MIGYEVEMHGSYAPLDGSLKTYNKTNERLSYGTPDFDAFVSKPHVRHLKFVQDSQWGEILYGEAFKRKGDIWHFKPRDLDQFVQMHPINLDQVVYRFLHSRWFQDAPAPFEHQQEGNLFTTPKSFMTLAKQEHFNHEITELILAEFADAVPGAQVEFYDGVGLLDSIRAIKWERLKRVSDVGIQLPADIQLPYVEFSVRGAVPIQEEHFYRLCNLLSHAGLNNADGVWRGELEKLRGRLFALDLPT